MRLLEQLALAWEPARKTYTVAELSARIRAMLESEFDDVWVAGEISGCRTASSGHCYFTLKDQEAQLRCVCFRNSLRLLKFKPRDGISVLVRGHIDVYEARGEYQLLVDLIEPQGYGALQFAFEQLKKKLAAEGLFDPGRKLALPKFPQRIGIVTSPTGAAIQDLLQITTRRFPGLHIRLYPALVQGDGAVESVCRAIEYFDRSKWAQVVILARGGGSLEDLWTFNEESVARAISVCSIPLISAIGHETDFTIADFVADLRAPTPSAAAEMVICTRQEVLEQVGTIDHKLLQAARYKIAISARRLHQQGVDRARTVLHRRIGRSLQRIDELEYGLRERRAQGHRAQTAEAARSHGPSEESGFAAPFCEIEAQPGIGAVRLAPVDTAETHQGARPLDPLVAHLTQLSPLKILERGYAIVQNEQGKVVKQPGDAPPGSLVDIRLAQGQLKARTTSE